MTTGVNGKRSYVSPLRAERANATRRAVLSSAIELFVANGYAATSIAAIARRADVSADTVFHLFGTKRSLFKEALDVAIGGDDRPVALLDREEPQRMRRETDQQRQLELFAAGITRQLERVRPLHDVLSNAAAVDAELASLRDDIQLRQRRAAMRAVAGWLAEAGRLAVDVERAADMLWTCTSPEVHRLFRVDCGWSPAEYQTWLLTTLENTVLSADR